MTDIILFQPKGQFSNSINLPTGLLFMASKAIESGHNVKIIDQRINNNWKEELSSILDNGLKIIYFSITKPDQLKNMMEASKFVIKKSPTTQTILGGEWIKIYPGLGMQDHNIDFVSYGDEDDLLNDVIDSIDGKKRVTEIFDIIYRPPEGAAIKKTNPKTNIANIDGLPKIPWGLIEPKYYLSKELTKGENAIEIQLNKGSRVFSIARIIKELERLELDFGIRNFFLVDELTTNNPERFIELADALSKKNYNWGIGKLDAECLNKINDEIIRKIANSGCKMIEFVFESGNKRILNLLGKNITAETILEKNKELSKYPLIIDYKFKGGFPTESKAEFLDTLNLKSKLLKENNNAKASISFYIPEPSIELYQLALSNGFIQPRSLNDWSENLMWYEKNSYWLTKEMVKLIGNAALLSEIQKENILFKIYGPIAKFRNANGFYGLMIEKYPLAMLRRLNKKTDSQYQIQKNNTEKATEEVAVAKSQPIT